MLLLTMQNTKSTNIQISRQIIRFGQIFLWLFSKLLVNLFFHVKPDKKVVVPEMTKPTIIISNHISLFDASIFVGSLSWQEFRNISPLRAMLAKWYYYSPLFPVTYLIGCYPARPLIPAWKKYSGTSGSVRHLNSGSSVGLYPEGQRTPDKRIKTKYGAVKILKQLDDPTVYLCRIEKLGKRKYEVVVDRNDSVAKLDNPDEIMDAVYALKK